MIDPDDILELERTRLFGRIEWMLGVAEATYQGYGADDTDKWDYNGPLLLAIQMAHAYVTELRMEHGPRPASGHDDEQITKLANAVATRLGEDRQAEWNVDQLAALAARAL